MSTKENTKEVVNAGFFWPPLSWSTAPLDAKKK